MVTNANYFNPLHQHCVLDQIKSAVQSQKAVSAYFTSIYGLMDRWIDGLMD